MKTIVKFFFYLNIFSFWVSWLWFECFNVLDFVLGIEVILKAYIITHLPFSAQGLFFLSGAWIKKSFFSFSSTYSRILELIKEWFDLLFKRKYSEKHKSFIDFRSSLPNIANICSNITKKTSQNTNKINKISYIYLICPRFHREISSLNQQICKVAKTNKSNHFSHSALRNVNYCFWFFYTYFQKFHSKAYFAQPTNWWRIIFKS